MRPYCEIYEQRNNNWGWRLKSTNHQVVCTPRYGLQNSDAAAENALNVKREFPKVTLADVQITGSGDAWRWCAKVGLTNVYPHQSFKSKRSAVRNLHLAASLFKKAKFKVV